MVELNTFSVVGRAGSAFGVAAATARPNVGSLVPWVSLRGAVATQARVNTDLGRQGMALLEQAVPLRVALPALLEADGEREIRQVHGVDGDGVFAHTGAKCVAWCGHAVGPDFSVAGNMLAGPEVLAAMAESFEASRGDGALDLAERLLRALEAGQAAGGDKRGKQSAALLVAADPPRLHHNLRVDDSTDPVAELRRLHAVVVAHSAQLHREYGAEAPTLFGRVKH